MNQKKNIMLQNTKKVVGDPFKKTQVQENPDATKKKRVLLGVGVGVFLVTGLIVLIVILTKPKSDSVSTPTTTISPVINDSNTDQTSTPTSVPTSTPTSVPTSTPTSVPTSTPTSVPTSTPTSVPPLNIANGTTVTCADIGGQPVYQYNNGAVYHYLDPTVADSCKTDWNSNKTAINCTGLNLYQKRDVCSSQNELLTPTSPGVVVLEAPGLNPTSSPILNGKTLNCMDLGGIFQYNNNQIFKYVNPTVGDSCKSDWRTNRQDVLCKNIPAFRKTTNCATQNELLTVNSDGVMSYP